MFDTDGITDFIEFFIINFENISADDKKHAYNFSRMQRINN